ncbi:hypothetical protein NL676_023303 [Syzygium grande]|nr:hypothetical protein NL676_023303 [Syzygium grande]
MKELSSLALVWKLADSTSRLAELPARLSRLARPSRALSVVTHSHGRPTSRKSVDEPPRKPRMRPNLDGQLISRTITSDAKGNGLAWKHERCFAASDGGGSHRFHLLT